ncbi:MAG: SGNH/GDSL hydrolase family protein, partial [Vicinamibacterales bacterium]
MSAKGSRLWLVAAALWTALSVFIWAGFLFGRSRDPLVLGYSGSFVLLLVALPVLLPLPIAGVWLARGMGWRRFFGEIGPTLALLAIVYLLAAGIYYQRQTHLFDPYTQSPGERIEDIDAPRTPGRLRVAALGGSTTAGPSLEPLERYPAQLQQRLLDAGHPADVFNGGQNWWTSRHSLTHYVTHVRHWHPDMVLVMHGINDLYRSFSPPDYAIGDYDPLYTHFYGASIQGARPPAFLESLFAQPIRLAGQQWYRPWRRREVDLPLSRFVSIEAFERNLRTLVHVVRADAAEPVLLTQPALFKPEPSADEIAVMRFGEEFCLTPTGRFTSEFPSPASLRRAMDAYNGVVKKIAADLDVPLVDL